MPGSAGGMIGKHEPLLGLAVGNALGNGESQPNVAEKRNIETPFERCVRAAALNTYSKPRDRATRVKVRP